MEKTQKKITIKGTLYHKEMLGNHGSIRFIQKEESKHQKIKRTLGAAATSISLAMFIFSYGPVVSKSLSFYGKPLAKNESNKIVTQVEASDTYLPSQEYDYTVVIPSLNIKSKILTNVDPNNEAEYDNALENGIAHAQGTGLPGGGRRIFLFAHSTNSISFIERFNAVFYDLDLLKIGDRVDINHDKDIYQYEVFDKKIVSSADTEWIKPHDGEELILQTCWPKGTNWKRLLVFAKPII